MQAHERVPQIENKKLKRFRCSHDCSKKFRRKRILKSHISGFHLRLKLYECHICHQDFRFMSEVLEHQKTQHDKVIRRVVRWAVRVVWVVRAIRATCPHGSGDVFIVFLVSH
jgi:hypothetical protein